MKRALVRVSSACSRVGLHMLLRVTMLRLWACRLHMLQCQMLSRVMLRSRGFCVRIDLVDMAFCNGSPGAGNQVQWQQGTMSVMSRRMGRRSQVRFLTACMLTRRMWAIVAIKHRRGTVLFIVWRIQDGRHFASLDDRCTSNSSSDSLVGLFGELAILQQVFAASSLLIRVPVCYGAESTLHVCVDDLEAINVRSIDPAKSVSYVSKCCNNAIG